MSPLSRRDFLKSGGKAAVGLAAGLSLLNNTGCRKPADQSFRGKIITVLGPIAPEELGATLPHEHVMVDFIGADKVGKHRYDAEEVYQTMLPYLQELRAQGVIGFVECTPMFLGRDPKILVRLARDTGLHILTNTGMYKEPYLPQYAFEQSTDELAQQWTDEIENGIEGTGVHAGFIKIAVHREELKPIQQKIVRAACRTHRATGATIACHTGHGPAAMQMLDILATENTPAHALIIVHANSEPEVSYHHRIAGRGAWVEYDNLGSWPAEKHIGLIRDMLDRGFGERLLLSMDRGWYHVGEPKGGEIKSFTYLFGEFVPAMREAGFDESTIELLTVTNPARAFELDTV